VPLPPALPFYDAMRPSALFQTLRKMRQPSKGMQEYNIMEKQEFEDKWKIIKDQSKVWWSLITDNDLDRVEKADVKLFEYLTNSI
jgi:hypothetical protein